MHVDVRVQRLATSAASACVLKLSDIRSLALCCLTLLVTCLTSVSSLVSLSINSPRSVTSVSDTRVLS